MRPFPGRARLGIGFNDSTSTEFSVTSVQKNLHSDYFVIRMRILTRSSLTIFSFSMTIVSLARHFVYLFLVNKLLFFFFFLIFNWDSYSR